MTQYSEGWSHCQIVRDSQHFIENKLGHICPAEEGFKQHNRIINCPLSLPAIYTESFLPSSSFNNLAYNSDSNWPASQSDNIHPWNFTDIFGKNNFFTCFHEQNKYENTYPFCRILFLNFLVGFLNVQSFQ